MSHHFVTVCVVCVLCAAHAPCSAHTDGQSPGAGSVFLGRDLQEDYIEGYKRPDDGLGTLVKSQTWSKEVVKIKDVGHEVERQRYRRKRHDELSHEHNEEDHFTKKIFEKYGNGESITIERFEELLQKLGLQEVIGKLKESEENADTDGNVEAVNGSTRSKPNADGSAGGKGKRRCMNSRELVKKYSDDHEKSSSSSSQADNSTVLPGWLLERVCPAIVYQLTLGTEDKGCIEVPSDWGTDSPKDDVSRSAWQVWLYSSISIVIISLCGLLGVVVIPVMNKTYYHQLIQFLVALAVGTLCGDALIHLLPHAMMSSAEHSHGSKVPSSVNHKWEHDSNMWKGLVAMMGLVTFFFTEKALTMIGEWRKFRQRRNKLPLRVKVMREPDTVGNSSVSDKHCKHKYSSYPYCYGEITTETQDNHHNRQHNIHQRQAPAEEEKPLTSNSNCVTVHKPEDSEVEKKQEDWKLEETIVNHSKKNSEGPEPSVNEAESYTVIIREHETKHHGHTHSHGHVHSAPESMSSVAWMVIMGDGLHNFTDGMAIGAAFAANIAGGFSTAIAVLCHELPHELGDFAVLLKAGMSAKQAVFYNLLSSVLCLFGMIVGILVGANPAATSWIFAAAAGMFIYIALVDMIPELTSSHSEEGGSQWQCVLQALGLLMGLGVMLIIALYEHDLKHIFSN